MFCNLPSYGECRVMVEYARDENDRPVHTRIEVFKNNNLLFDGESWCHPNDVCRKQIGRKYALLDLFDRARKYGRHIAKEDKSSLFKLVCPKFFRSR